MLSLLVVLFGALVGSFLNCLIYRLPRNLSLLEPKRSFCPHCQRSLPWFENIPIFSWIFLQGRCASCHASIGRRYIAVEMLSALLFWLCYCHFSFPLVIAMWLLVGLLLSASFIDLEHLLIPNTITLGGMVLGLLCSLSFPELMGVSSPGLSFFYSLLSAALSYLILWFILEVGKKIFGKKKFLLQEPQLLELLREEDHVGFSLRWGEELLPLEELFTRSSDTLLAKATLLQMGEKRWHHATLILTPEELRINDQSFLLQDALPLSASIREMTLPREAMGFGDVKFLACLASFLGWKGALFSLFGGSIIGAVVGTALLLITHGRLGRLLPFGPYLSLGALAWMLYFSKINFL